jgi:hypothetical protein
VWDAAFLAASNVGRVHPGDWLHIGTVLAAIVGKSAGLAALAVAGAAMTGPRPRAWADLAASLLAAAITLLAGLQLVRPLPWVTGMLAAIALFTLIIALPACVIRIPPPEGDRWIDAAIGLYGGAELILLVILCRSSSGAWINYGIPAVVFASVLTARALARAADARPRSQRAILVAAVVAVLASVLMDAKVEVNRRRMEHDDLARIFASTGLPPAACFFADRPGLNRMSGRLEWVYDDWLYPAFESLKLAEPRARWLRPLLGPTAAARAVVLESDADRLDGIPEPLPALGFQSAGRVGSFRVWTVGSPSPRAR